MPVHRIAGWWQLGLSVEEIAEKHPTVGPAEIHGALAYYHPNRVEIERCLADERNGLAEGSHTKRRRVSEFRLHLDEDTESHALVRTLRDRGAEATTTSEAG